MRQKVKRYSRSAISILLTLCMIMSCMTVGIIATDAAKVSADEAVGANGFIKGSWDNWQQHYFTYEVSLPANTSYRFDVYKSSGQQCANDGVKISGTTQYTANNNNNGSMILETGAAGTYKFTYVSDDSGSMTFRVEFPSVTVSSVTAVGDSTALFGTAWAPTATANDMTNSGTTWSKTWTNVSLPAGTIQYKVALNHSWDITYPTDNKSQTVSSAGIYDVTVTYDSSTNAVNMTLTNKTPHKFELAATENAVVKASYNSTTIQEGGEFASVPQGETITVTVTPDVGYKIQSVTATNSGTVSGSGNTRTVTMPNADTKVTVTMVSVGKRTVYFNNNNTKYAMVTAKYTYNGETVTSTMTKLSNSNIWSIEVPGDLDEITFIGDNGYNTGDLEIPPTSTYEPPMYTAGFTPSSPATGGTWGKYNERSNVYTVSKGSTLNNTDLFTGISATFYDYYTDGEISTGWINGIGAKEYSRHNGSKFTWNPFTTLNSAISDYSSASKNNVWRPLYFGNLNVTSGNGTTLSIDTDGNSSSAVIKAYTGWDQNANNSINLNPATKAITDLSGQTLAGSTIHYYKNGATNENGAPMAIFDEDFLSGLNNQNKALASILRSPAFPVRKTTKSDHAYYEFDSTDGTDNAYFTTIDKTNKTAVLDYYAASANKTVASSTPSGTSKGFFPFDYGNIQNNTSDLWSTDYIYLDVSNTTGGSSWWACFRNNSTDSYSYVQMEHVSGNLYRCLNPDWASKVAFTKNSNNNQPSGNWGDGNNVYNYISDVSVPTGNNQNIMFKTSGYSGQAINGSWQAPAAQYLSHRAHDLGFGAKLEIPFTLEQGGYFQDNNAAQVFEFSGDDDLWVFIDNKLVLDLGGAHTRAQGTINFKDRTVSVTTGQQKADNTANDRNISFASWFDNSNPNQPHTMTIYYLERGMYDSNLKFGFSFHPIPNQFTAEKKVRTANINGGFYTINSNTQSPNMTLDGGRAITKFEETYQNEDFEITHKVDGSLIGALNYTLTEKDDNEATGTKTSTKTVANGKYTIQNDDLATFVNNITKNTTFNLTESFPASNKYKYTPSIEVYDDGHNKQLFTAVNTTPSAAGEVQTVGEGSYTFKFSETNPITGMENLNIRARFINQMNSHDLTIKKETNDPTDTTTTFNLKVLFKFGDYDYTPYPLTCTLNGVDTALAADGSIAVKNGDTIIIPKVPENANVRIIEELDDATSAYSYVGTDVKYSDGTTFDGTVTDSLTAKRVDFAIGTKDTTAIVNNHKCYLSTNHTLYDSPIGSGNTYTTVTVKNASGGTVDTYAKTSGMITVDPRYIKASSTNVLEIVLETEPNSGYKFDEFYENITGTMNELAASGTGYTAVFDPSGTKVTVTVPVSALFANNEQAYTLLPFYSKLSIPEKPLTINKTVDVAADGENAFDVKVEYYDGSNWVAYNDEGDATDANGMGSVAANGSLTVTLKGVAATNEVRVTEIPKAGTKYQAPVYALTSGGTRDTSYSGEGIAFTSTLTQNPVVGITNNIKRQNFTITKKIDVASDPAGTFTFMVNLNGSAIPDTYQYQIGNGTAQNFSGGVATMTGSVSGTTMTVLNIPVGASIEVYESNSGAGYDLNSVSFTTGTGTINNNNHATFTVTDGTTHALEFTNYKKQTVTIKKELIEEDSDVDDPATAFKFKIKVDGQDYKSRVKLDNADYDPVNGVYELKINQIMALSNIARGAVVNVVEIDHIDDYYQYDSTTVTGATKETATAIDGSTDGAKFTVGNQPVAVVVKNKARRVDVVINKKTDFPVDDGSEFVIDVKSRQRNSQNNNPVANNSGTVSTGSTNNGDGTYKLIKNGTITFTNVPKGTYFIVNETSQGTYTPINGARFTKQSIHAYPTSTASNPQYIQVKDDSQNLTDELTARSVPMTDNTTFVVSNIVKRNDLIIAKTISDATDHDTEHTLTVVLKQSESGAAYTDLTYQYKRHGDADWSTEQSFTSGGTIKIHQDEKIKFSNVPIGSYISILETSPNGNYTLDNINVTNYISGSLDKDSVTNQVSFLTADGTGATNVTITNKLQRFDLAVTKNTDSKVSDTFKVKVLTSDAQNGPYNDMVFDAAGQFTISGLTDEAAYTQYNTTTHEISLTKDQTLTVKNLAINSYVKVVETNAGAKHEWQNYTPATGTTIKNTVSSAADGAIVQMTADQALTINNKIKTQNVTIEKVVTNSSSDHAFPIHVKVQPKGSSDGITGTYKYKVGNGSVQTKSDASTTDGLALTIQQGTAKKIQILEVPVGAQVIVEEDSLSGTNFTFENIASTDAGGTKDGQAYTFTVADGTDPTVTITNSINTRDVEIGKRVDTGSTAKTFPIKVEVTQTKGTFTMPADFTNNVKSFTHGAANDVTLTVPLDATVKVTEENAGIPAGFEFEKITLGGTDVSATGNSYTYTGDTSDTADKEILVHNTELHKLTVTKTVEGTDNTTDTFTFKAYKWDSSNSTWTDETQFTLTKGASRDVFTNVRKGEKFKVVEVVPDKYTYDTTAAKTKVEGATGSAAFTDATNKTYGFQNIVMGTADVNVTVNNIVKTKTVKISKTTNYTEAQNDGAFGFNVKTKADGAAAGTAFTNCTYKYKINGTGDEQTFNNGNFTLTNGQFITIENVPVDTQFEVEETNSLSATSTTETYTGLTADSNLTDKTAHFTVSTDDNQEVNFFNSKNKTLKIKKTKPAADSDINDTTTSFYISVRKYNTDTSAYVPYNGNVGTDYNATSGVTLANGVFTLKMGGEVTINVNDGEQYEVKEIDIDSKYTLSGVTGGDTDVMDGSNKVVGRSATIGTENVEITFTNQIKRHNVIVQKEYSSGDSNTAKHTVVVTVRPNGQSSEVGKTENTETQFKKGTNYVVSNVPAGAYVTVEETAFATGYVLDNISDAAFTMPADANKTVTVTNKLQKRTVTIVKQVVDKDDQVLTDDTSTFTLDVTAGGTTTHPTITQAQNVAFDVDYGTAVTVEEQAKAGYKLKDISTIPATITENTTITVTNYRVHDVTITKTVDDPSCTAYFPIKVKVNDTQIQSLNDYTFAAAMPTTTGGDVYFDDANDVFMLKAGESFTIKDLVENTTVDVLENTADFGNAYAYNATGSSVTDDKGTPTTDGDHKGFTGITVDKNVAVTIANKALHTVEITKTTDKETTNTFNIKVFVGDNTNLIDATGWTVALSNVTEASDHYVFQKNGKITISGVPYGTQFKVLETDGGSTDFKFSQTDSTVTGAVKTAIDTEGVYGYTFTTAHADVNAVVHNKETAKYQYEIKYIYEGYTATTFNNDGSFKEGPQRFFIATGELTTDEWNEFVDTSQENTLNAGKADNFITKTAPHEDDFMMNLQFKSSEIKNVVVDKANKKVSFEVTATTTPERDVYVYFQLPYAVDENLVATGDTFIPYQQKDATTVYGHWVQKNGSFISAPLTLKDGSNTRYFQYWQIRSRTAESGRNKGKVETDYKRCYYADFNMTMYQDSYVTAVYTTAQTDYNPNAASYQDTKDGEARINFIENSRNQWNSDGGGAGMTGDKLTAGDRVYSDFLVTYGYQDKQLNALGNSDNVKTGLVVEQVAELDKDQYGDYKTKSQSEYHQDTCYGSSEADAKEKVVDFVKTGAAAGVPVKDEITSKFIANQTVQLKNLDNKNQAKYSLNLLNKAYGTNTPSDKYKIYVFRAYSYIKVSDNVVVSDPTYFTIYDIASIEP